MHSGLYEGWVRHRRFAPVSHEFRYRLWLAWLDLDELDEVFRGRLFWSAHRPALARFRRDDHLGDPCADLRDSVRDLVAERLGRRPAGPIRLLTQLRYAGFWMNPVCFYYCYDRNGTSLDAIVAEVNNTPWNEQHCYVLDPRAAETPRTANAETRHLTTRKEFHVSPFMGMDQTYHWSIGTPGDELSLRLANHEGGRRIFQADLDLARRELTTGRMAWLLCRYPFQSLRVFAAIYRQALKLWWKKCPLYPHPEPPPPSASAPPNSPPSPPSIAGAAPASTATSTTQATAR